MSAFDGISRQRIFSRLESLYLHGFQDPFVVLDLLQIAKQRPPGERCWSAEYETLTYWIDCILLKHPQTAPELLAELTRLLDDDDPEVRELAARCVGEYGPSAKQAVPDLRLRLVDPDGHVAIQAARAVARIEPGDASFAPAVEAKLGSPESAVVVAALATVERMGPRARSLVPAVAAHLESSNPSCRMLAALALIEIAADHDPVMEGVRALESDPDPDVRSLVANHLRARIGR